MARKIGSRYTIDRVLGRGSAGTVWAGSGPEGPVAVKLLREDLASDPELVGRFVQERSALTGLDHPCVVGVHDLVVDGDDLALVMELVHGEDLRSALDRAGVLPPQRAAAVVADVAEGLAAAHAEGVVHRDVKPENVLLDDNVPPGGDPRARLTDFGIARLVDSPRRTRATRIIGTPDYLAPEIIEGLQPRAAVDVYALATVLYELLCGRTPFGGVHPGAVLRRHVTEAVPPLTGLPDGLARVLTACLAKAPASRLTAAELADRLQEQLPDLAGLPPLQARPAARPDDEDADADGAEGGPLPEPRRPRRGAVALVPGGELDEHDTHLRIRRPTADELASGAPAAGGDRSGPPRDRGARGGRERRPGGALPASVRRRRLAVALAGLLIVAALGAYGISRAVGGDSDIARSGSHAADRHAPSSPGAITPTAPTASGAAEHGAHASGTPTASLPHWSAWSKLPPPPVPPQGAPVAVRSGHETLVFVRDSAANLWYAVRNGTSYQSWTRLTGIHVSGRPAAVALGGGRVRLVARGTDELLYERGFDHGQWGLWTQVDGRTRFDSAPAAASPGKGRIDLVGRTGGNLVTASYVDGRWSAWAVVPTAGRIAGTPALVSRGDGTLDAFVAQARGGAVLRLHAEDGAWLPASTVRGLPAGTGIAAVGAEHGALRVFSRAKGGAVHVAVSGADGAGWAAGPVPHADAAGDAVGAAEGPGSRTEVYVLGSGGSVRTASTG